ncbi:MAG: TetR/AcrR family transcriptional regulator [Humibacillus sp.]|nr:TetR/AcrR family transcriptional regulator [Humibacillus sp.]MDN5778411.1 TetR/AcrR family transcriptional regulator [Humibacillus sp.]
MATTDQPHGKRARRREQIEGEILRVAREHLALHGAAALSLRAIARDLGMVSSGIYRYVESRDDLLTRLIIDSYRSLADAVFAAHDAVDANDLDRRWATIGFALRQWALDQPHDFALIYGSPVPDYQAPADRTAEAGTAVLGLLLRLLQDAHDQHRLTPVDEALDRALDDESLDDLAVTATALSGAPPSDAVRAVGPMLAEPFFAGISIGSAALARGLAAWTLLLGAVTSEVFAQLGPVPDADALFRLHLDVARSLILLPAQSSTGLSTAVFTA